MTFAQWEAAFPDEAACKAYLTRNRWPSGISCPRCGNVEVKAHGTMEFNWLCNACSPSSTNYRFSVIAGTVFENTNKPLRDWFRVVHLMLTSKKGISALQVHRMMGFGSYSTAWYMCMRVRAGLANEDFRKLMGIVEVDETFVGGKDENRHWQKKNHVRGGNMDPNKFVVIGAVQRAGNVVARVIENTKTETFENFVRQFVSIKVSILATDDARAYISLGGDYPHHAVRHRAKNYVVGAVHTNTIEGFWSLIKRGVMGSYHKVSRKYLPLYVAEFQFRYNNRSNPNIFAAAIRGC
ncbi:MAG: IS1595 family transposase [Alphaproteobacteria bacterium]|nr:IS1595 family transposase [Alphaproteobacteria bacterium]